MNSQANATLPRAARQALTKLGEDIMVARKKRRISTNSMALSAFVSHSTYTKIEKGDPNVSIGAYASVLTILGMADAIGKLADSTLDPLELDIKEDLLPVSYVPNSDKIPRRNN